MWRIDRNLCVCAFFQGCCIRELDVMIEFECDWVDVGNICPARPQVYNLKVVLISCVQDLLSHVWTWKTCPAEKYTSCLSKKAKVVCALIYQPLCSVFCPLARGPSYFEAGLTQGAIDRSYLWRRNQTDVACVDVFAVVGCGKISTSSRRKLHDFKLFLVRRKWPCWRI